jgi:hypothetical protein
MFASFCDVKGPTDAYALDRLENFLKEEGVSEISYRSDQESAIVSLIETALKNNGKAGEVTDASPEHSAAGESTSNGGPSKLRSRRDSRRVFPPSTRLCAG